MRCRRLRLVAPRPRAARPATSAMGIELSKPVPVLGSFKTCWFVSSTTLSSTAATARRVAISWAVRDTDIVGAGGTIAAVDTVVLNDDAVLLRRGRHTPPCQERHSQRGGNDRW